MSRQNAAGLDNLQMPVYTGQASNTKTMDAVITSPSRRTSSQFDKDEDM